MDPAEQLRRLYERLPAGSAFRRAIEQTLEIAQGLTGIKLIDPDADDGAAPPAADEDAPVAPEIAPKP